MIRRRLTQLGWADDDAAEYTTSYQLRTPIAAIPVNDDCPAITASNLAGLGRAQVRIREVSYTADFEGLGVLDGTKQFNRLLFKR
jgi:hypothetical protein